MAKPLLPLRIIVVDPPAGVTFALQRGPDQIEPPMAAGPDEIRFDFCVDVSDTPKNPPRLLGPFVQGRPDARFVYVGSGTMAGQPQSCWTRRAKVPLDGITAEQINEVIAHPDSVLQVRIPGRSRDGGPVCASVKPIEGWVVIR